MNLVWIPYLFGLLGNLDRFLFISGILIVVVLILSSIAFWINHDLGSEEDRKVILNMYKTIRPKLMVSTVLLCFALRVFIPSEKVMYLMLAGYSIDKGTEFVSESEEVKKLFDKSNKALNKMLDDYVGGGDAQ